MANSQTENVKSGDRSQRNSLWSLFFGDHARHDKNEVFAHEWTTLQSTWRRIRPTKNNDDPRVAEIDEIIRSADKWRSDMEGWEKLNSAEQRIGEFLEGDIIKIEYQNLLDIATDRKLPSLPTYQGYLKNLFNEETPASKFQEQKQAAYMSLLYVLQSGFVETRMQRSLRHETADRLFRFGLFILGLTLIVPGIYFISYLVQGISGRFGFTINRSLITLSPAFEILFVISFSVLGAYFSRVSSFQTRLQTLSFDEVMNTYQPRMLFLRLLFGLIGGLIFYYLIRSHLVGGDALPNLGPSDVETEKLLGTFGKNHESQGENIRLVFFAPLPDMAKLLIWSFIAGFFERLVPDTLEKVQSSFNTKTP